MHVVHDRATGHLASLIGAKSNSKCVLSKNMRFTKHMTGIVERTLQHCHKQLFSNASGLLSYRPLEIIKTAL